MGRPLSPPSDDQRKMADREYAKRRRAQLRADGKKDDWHKRNPDRHRSNVAKWRAENLEKARGLTREGQKRRRSTPWGKINNCIWSVMHAALRATKNRKVSKYTTALGYSWATLRTHLEAQFTPDMNWGNWGDVWEVDHIVAVSRFEYTSLIDPLFREAWALTNLRPLARQANATKGNR